MTPIRRCEKSEVAALYARVKVGRVADSASGPSTRESRSDTYTGAIADMMNRADFADLSQAVQSLLTLLAIEHICDRAKIEEEFKKSALYNTTHWKEKWIRLGEQELDLAIRNARDNIAKRLTRTKPEEAPHAPLVFSTASSFLRKTYKKRESLMVTIANGHPVFHTASINQIHAFRGVGKTAFGLGLCGASLTEGEFLQWKATRKFRTLYIEGELPGEEMQERVRMFVGESDDFAVITPEDQPDSIIPSLMTAEGRRLIEEAIVSFRAEVVFLDSISTLANIATNDEAEWLTLCEWFRYLRNKYGVALFFLMHDGKTGLQRGHSKSEDLLDKSVQLFWENGYRGQDGLKFSLTFDKARKPVNEANSLSVELVEENGRPVWVSTVRDSSGDSQKAMAFAMFEEGLSIEKVRDRLRVAKGSVNEWKKEWKAAKNAKQQELSIEDQASDAPGF
jgi:hypothetical protein